MTTVRQGEEIRDVGPNDYGLPRTGTLIVRRRTEDMVTLQWENGNQVWACTVPRKYVDTLVP